MPTVWTYGLNWAWLSGPFMGYGVDPNWAPANIPVGTLDRGVYCVDSVRVNMVIKFTRLDSVLSVLY